MRLSRGICPKCRHLGIDISRVGDWYSTWICGYYQGCHSIWTEEYTG